MKKFELVYSLEIIEVDERGTRVHNNGLRVSDSVTLHHMGFMEVAQVMGRFHELAEAIRKDREL